MNSKFKELSMGWQLDATPVVLKVMIELKKSLAVKYKARLDALAQDFGINLPVIGDALFDDTLPVSGDIDNWGDAWNCLAFGHFNSILGYFIGRDGFVERRSRNSTDFICYETVPYGSLNFFKEGYVYRFVDKKIIALWDELMKEGDLV